MEEEIPKLRLVDPDSPSELARRHLKEQLALQREREFQGSVSKFRVGSVPYLNAVPLTRGIEDEIQFAPPAKLAELLRKGELDAALVSVTEVLFHDIYDVLDGVAVASLGEVKSVFVAHRKPLEQAREIFCDTASLTSLNLLRVLLAERGVTAELKPLSSYPTASDHDFVLLIGDPALEFLRSNTSHQIWDLGSAWFELTRLPFVYAVWAIRRGVPEVAALKKELLGARDFGLDTLDQIIKNRKEFDFDFRKDYLSWHIHYHLGADEKKGIGKFIELLLIHQDQPVHPPRFV